MAAQVVDDLAERREARHDAEIDIGKIGHEILHGTEDLDALDRVDTQVGLELHLPAQHLRRVTGPIRHDPHQQRRHLRRRHTSRHRRWCRLIDAARDVRNRGRGHEGGRGRRWCDRRNRHGWSDGWRGGGGAGRAGGRERTGGGGACESAEDLDALLGGGEERTVRLGHRVQIRRVCRGGLLLSALVGREHARIRWRNECRCSGRRRRREGLVRHRRGSSSGRRRCSVWWSSSGHGVRLGEFVQIFGWIGARVVGSVDRNREFRLPGVVRVRHLAVPAPQCSQLHVDPGSCESAEAVEQGRDAASPLLVERNSQVFAVVENVVDQAGQDRRWPDLDERAGATGVHRLDHLDEPDRLGELARQLDPHRIDVVVRVRRRGLVGVDRHDR